MPVEGGNRHELAAFLRSRRERVTPESVGLPSGARRRTVGLRREEVAVLAGLSPTWYTYLEQGRNIRPSAEVLDSLARVLLLGEDERRYMHTLAYGHTSVSAAEQSRQEREELLRGVVDITDTGTAPVYAGDRFCDVLAWNQAAKEWYTDFGKIPAERRNMLLWMLSDPQAQYCFVNWEYDVKDLIARVRWITAPYRGHPRLEQVVAMATEAHPMFEQWWAEHDVHVQRTRERRLRHPVHGEYPWRFTALYPSDYDDVMVIFHLP
ncbi:helix-turn-helix transcriptional regulator [Kutzneria chonburiensis]|uniref:Helix-turn-helix transcriptional regulator n=1 Tax=Kutzneria chonburiensis TaxID=1483604 RepID=A0ABV6N5J8_9PSEU